MRRLLLGLFVVGLGFAASPVQAVPGNDSITVADGVLGGTVTAVISDTSLQFARAYCTQNDVVVYEEFVSVADPTFHLGPTASWMGGDAECVAELGYLRQHGANYWRVVADDGFHVDG